MASADSQVTPSLYVGDLSSEVNEALLFEIFNAVGPVASIRVCRDANTKQSLGYAYVNFHNVSDAELAIETMNFSNIGDRACRIMWSQRDPSLRKSGVGNIFVKNLDKSIDHKALYDTFSMFGNILSCKVATNSDGESLGYGFVHYETEEAAKKAIDNVNGMIIAEKNVFVGPFVPKEERDSTSLTFTNIYIKNLPKDFTQEELDTMFSEFGEITSSYLPLNDDDTCKGFGFVNFEDPDAAAKAVETMHESDSPKSEDGTKLYVSRAMKKSERKKFLTEKFDREKKEREAKWAGCNLYVKNLDDSVDSEALEKGFEQFGTITSARVIEDSVTKKSKGFGFVCFSTAEEAQEALTEMNNKVFEGKPLYVALAQKKEIRRAQLEQQYAQSARPMKMGPMSMFPPAAASMYYPAGARGGFMYPAPMGRRYAPANAAPLARPMYQAPVNNSRSRRGRGGNRSTGRGETGGSALGKLTLQSLANASPEDQNQMIGERLYPLIKEIEDQRAGKITGMLLEMDNEDLLHLLETPEALEAKVAEAVEILEEHENSMARGDE